MSHKRLFPSVSAFLRRVLVSRQIRRIALTVLGFIAIIGLGLKLFGVPARARTPGADEYGAATVHERFTPFLDGDGFQAQLLIQNLTSTKGVVVTPEIILENGNFYLKPQRLGPHSTATVDIHAALLSHGSSAKRGTVAIRYKMNSYGGVTSAVESADWSHHLYLLSYGQSGEEYWAGTAYDAALWAPDDGTDGFVTLTNTTAKPKTVQATFLLDGASRNIPPIVISPRQTYWLSVADLVGRSKKSGAGVHLEVSGKPGDVVVEGSLINQRTGFAKYIHFMDKALAFPTGILRSHLVLLGQQAPEDDYPPQVSFHSVAVVRNIDSTTVGVTPTIKYLLNGSVQSVALTPVTLNVGESRVIDFSREQKDGALPSDLHQATLELAPDTGKISILAELFNFDEATGGYVVGPSFVSYPSKGSSSVWRIDGSYQTTVMVQNTASRDDEVNLKLYSDDGGEPYEKSFPIAAGGILKINVRELQENQVPDKDGNLLAADSGVMAISGSHGPQSKLSLDKVIHSADVADYVGLPNNPCDYVTAVSIIVSGSQNPFTLLFQYTWVQAGDQYGAASITSSSNTSVVQIIHADGGDLATITPIDGQTHTAFISAPPVSAESCDACSGDVFVPQEAQVHVPAKLTVTGISPSRGLIGNTTSVTISGTDLSGATVTAPSGITPTVTSSGGTSLDVDLNVAGTATAGSNTLTVHSSGSPPQTATINFFVQIPKKLIRLDYPNVPNGYGPLQVISNGNVVNVAGTVLLTHQCGMYRNLVYSLRDQDSPDQDIDGTYTLTEMFSNYSSTYGGVVPPTQNLNMTPGGVLNDIQWFGKNAPSCPGSNDHESFSQSHKVTVGGTVYPLSTVNSIQRGNYSGVAHVDVTITTP